MTTEINTIVPAEIPLKPSVAVKDCINEFSKEQVLTVQDHNVYVHHPSL